MDAHPDSTHRLVATRLLLMPAPRGGGLLLVFGAGKDSWQAELGENRLQIGQDQPWPGSVVWSGSTSRGLHCMMLLVLILEKKSELGCALRLL